MNGHVDDSRRALIEVAVRASPGGDPKPITAWIDTAFNGHFVFPRELIERIGLAQESATEAILADGSQVLLESFVCQVDWFGEEITAQVIANDGRLPLLGTELLGNRRLEINYRNGTLEIN